MIAHTADPATTAAQRMEALGRLAGGVAHDFNNVLMVISGYAEMLAHSVGDDPDAKDAVQTILEASERAGALTRQLLLFSRRQSIEPADVPVAPAVLALEKMLRRLVPEDVTLVIEAADPGGLVARVDPGQLDQVVLNLVANARDAMPGGGRLTIRVDGVYRPAFVDASGERALAGDYVLLTVSDTGAGMEESVRTRIFEPFFTTKSVGKGTGLGLATVYGIVKSSGGYVDVHSSIGRGTTFEVYFPRAGEAVLIDAPADLPVAAGRETILVAEDDGVVRGLLQRTLAAAGYQVLTATDGTEAMAVARGHVSPIDLLLADLVMPQVGGRELLAQLREGQPGIRAMFLTAHTEHAAVDAELAHSSARLLRKPCRPRVLLQAIRETLDGPSAAPGVRA
ncbi:MAG: ATP-binding protein [Vicinamibacterales bacterium]